jgi:hypothetical protein
MLSRKTHMSAMWPWKQKSRPLVPCIRDSGPGLSSGRLTFVRAASSGLAKARAAHHKTGKFE